MLMKPFRPMTVLKFKTFEAISFKRSRRDLSIDIAEHYLILKNNPSSYYPHFSFTTKTGIVLPKTGVLFLL